MSFLKRIIISSGVLAAGYITPALSADMPRLPPPPVTPVYKPASPEYQPAGMPAPHQQGIQAYFRLDAGLGFYNEVDEESEGKTLDGTWDQNGVNIGAGIGIEINDFFRADITGEYRSVKDIYQECPAALAVCNDINHDLTSLVGFANGYANLGNFDGLTPYVGGGVGFAKHATKNVKAGIYDGSEDTDADMSFAWNLQAGASVDMSKNATFDVNYRYSHLGSFEGSTTVTQPTFTSTAEIGYEAISSHDIRAGIRYYFK